MTENLPAGTYVIQNPKSSAVIKNVGADGSSIYFVDESDFQRLCCYAELLSKRFEFYRYPLSFGDVTFDIVTPKS